VDAIVPRELLEREGARIAADLAAGRAPRRPKAPLVARLLEAASPGRRLVEKKARAAIAAETKGFYPAPAAALDVLMAQHGKSIAEGFALEQAKVGELLFGPPAQELIRLFKLTRDGSRPPIYARSSGAARVREVAVIGAGVMGAGIAQVCVLAGFPTRIVDTYPESLVRARAAILAELKKKLARRDLAPHDFKRRLASITFSTAIEGLRGVDLVIEAAPERREVKDSVLRAIAAAVREVALIATNTSSFPLAELAASVTHPERFIGLHFFNPAPKMPLVEVVRGPGSAEAAVERGVRFAKDLGKTPLVTADGPGFLVNRLLAPYLNEACKLAATGVPIPAIDRDLEAFGMPMGPFTLMDTVGLDVLKDVGDHLAARGGAGVHPMVLRLAEAKRFGRKSGRGFYRWSAAGAKEGLDADATTGVTSQAPPNAAGSIAARLIDVMIAEGRAALADRLVPTAEEVDLGTIFGVGFPPWRGGLMRYAATRARAQGGAS
jgi:3-hydroxyacyl-CoA dehydrogenase / enoyl-CoA hydratase / 3-hydroxybutyryl-CoA epimerase